MIDQELRDLIEEIVRELVKQGITEETKKPVELEEGDERLSDHFTLKEMTFSQSAIRHKIRNIPNQKNKENLKRLCEKVLEPVREHFGKPVKISSGYRSPALNKKIGGSSTSDHTKGYAADFEIKGISNYEVAKWIEKNLNYKQLILEFYTRGQPNSGWIHVSYAGEPFKNQELTALRQGRRTKYINGLVE